MNEAAVPTLVVMSGPSGAGKSTLISRLLGTGRCQLAVSATTRGPRPGEEDGRDYHFVDRATFEGWKKAGDLLEWAEVHDELYGTPRREIERSEKHTVILDIDVQGWRSVKEKQVEAKSVFIAPPHMQALETRLRSRGSEDEARIQRRLAAAAREMEAMDEYDFRIVNDDLERAAAELLRVLHLDSSRA